MDEARDEVAVTVDLAVLTVREDQLRVLLVERGKEPYLGALALPGGFVHPDEDLDDGAARELKEETNLGGLRLEQFGAYGTPGRDPRKRVVTVAYLAIVPNLPEPVAGTDARHAHWRPVADVFAGRIRLAFDHLRILTDAVERARSKLEYTTLATEFCPPEFTIGELRRVYEVVWGTDRIDPRNFHRKVVNAAGFVEATGAKRALETGRPASLYTAPGRARVLYPPMLRP